MKKVNELKTKNEELKNVVGSCESLDVALAKKKTEELIKVNTNANKSGFRWIVFLKWEVNASFWAQCSMSRFIMGLPHSAMSKNLKLTIMKSKIYHKHTK